MDHVASIHPSLLPLILEGTKRTEIRLSTTKPPAWRVSSNDRLFFCVRGRGIVAAAQVGAVERLSNLTPRLVEDLAARYGSGTSFSRRYWASRRDSRYAVVMELGSVQRVAFPAAEAPRGRSWVSDFQGGHLAQSLT